VADAVTMTGLQHRDRNRRAEPCPRLTPRNASSTVE
jgi:hypothetical protein